MKKKSSVWSTQILTFILVFMTGIILSPMTLRAKDVSEDTTTGAYQKMEPQTFIYINPLYSDVISEEDLAAPVPSRRPRSVEETEYLSVEEAIVSIREQLKQRLENISLLVEVNVSDYTRDGVTDYAPLFDEIQTQAFAHTGVSTEGDYLNWQYGGLRGAYSTHSDGVKAFFDINYTTTYYSTAEQEAELDTVIQSVENELGLFSETKSPYEKVRAVYDYMCENIVYDYDNLENPDYKLKYTAYAALVNRTSVCQGYAVLFYRMMLDCGIDARLIAGTSNGGAHSWNIVKLGNYYYNLDATWDAIYHQTGYGYRCMLKAPENFEDHERYDLFATPEFHSSYPMTPVDYDSNHAHVYDAWNVETDATCTEAGLKHRTCSICGLRETEPIPMSDHAPTTDEAVPASCTEDGKTEGSHCSVCGEVLTPQTPIPAKGHTPAVDKAADATCTQEGKSEGSHCSVCGEVLTPQTPIPAKRHRWGEWSVTSDATVFAAEQQIRTCGRCDACETRTFGAPLKKELYVNAGALTLKTKQKTKALRVYFANGDSVKSWTSSNQKVVKISGKPDGSCTITAQKKTGKAFLTVTLTSGVTKKIKIKVQKKAVTTTSLKLPTKKVSLEKGTSFTLQPVITPITSQDKITYKTSNRKIVSVTSKGVLKARKNGTVKITIKAGKKKAVCTVTVK